LFFNDQLYDNLINKRTVKNIYLMLKLNKNKNMQLVLEKKAKKLFKILLLVLDYLKVE